MQKIKSKKHGDIFSLKTFFLALYLWLLIFSRASFATHENIAVFYPESKEPYRAIYQEIVKGIESAIQSDDIHSYQLKEFQLNTKSDTSELVKELKILNIQKVIVLGRAGWRLAKTIAALEEFQIVTGALPTSPNNIAGVSLIADPLHLFSYLKDVAPTVENIHVAYNPKNQWLIDLATPAAEKKNLTLTFKKVETTQEAIHYYDTLFQSDISSKDAIWLPIDKVSSHDKITLPFILEKSWAKEVVVFSSKPSHAKRGVLFSIYPDNYLLGKQLFTMAKELSTASELSPFSALKSTLLAVNLRTAAHLGLSYSAKQQQEFKLTFPE